MARGSEDISNYSFSDAGRDGDGWCCFGSRRKTRTTTRSTQPSHQTIPQGEGHGHSTPFPTSMTNAPSFIPSSSIITRPDHNAAHCAPASISTTPQSAWSGQQPNAQIGSGATTVTGSTSNAQEVRTGPSGYNALHGGYLRDSHVFTFPPPLTPPQPTNGQPTTYPSPVVSLAPVQGYDMDLVRPLDVYGTPEINQEKKPGETMWNEHVRKP